MPRKGLLLVWSGPVSAREGLLSVYENTLSACKGSLSVYQGPPFAQENTWSA